MALLSGLHHLNSISTPSSEPGLAAATTYPLITPHSSSFGAAAATIERLACFAQLAHRAEVCHRGRTYQTHLAAAAPSILATLAAIVT